jgi:hypothetical protein
LSPPETKKSGWGVIFGTQLMLNSGGPNGGWPRLFILAGTGLAENFLVAGVFYLSLGPSMS